MNSAETMCFLEVTLIYSSSKNDFLEVAVKSQKKGNMNSAKTMCIL